jgi:uncharacterized protein involved in type VI secretion and phage assembly
MAVFEPLTTGAACGLELSVGGKRVPAPGDVRWREATALGAWLEARFAGGPDVRPRVGQPVELRWSSEDQSAARTEGQLRLWCSAVHAVTSRGQESYRIEARDVLGFCAEEPQFRSYPGRVTLDQVAKAVLAFQPGTLEGLEVTNPAGTQVREEYLLQCRESGAAFLARVAAASGCTWFWNRRGLALARSGEAAGEVIRLDDAGGPARVEVIETAEPALAALGWVDPVSREGRLATVKPAVWSGARGVRGLTRPARTTAEPAPGAWLGEGITRPWNGTTVFWTTHASLAPGTAIEHGAGPRLVVDEVRHEAGGRGGAATYSNVVVAVPEPRWGLRRAVAGEAMAGPFQAVVMENDDPERMGRLRVALSEDPERRISPWVPQLTLSADSEAGSFWMPEKGTLVLVAAPTQCPECLVVLGALRGSHQRVPARWRSADNAHKAFAFRNGVRIEVDDQARRLRFETAKGVWELDGDGRLLTNGHEWTANFQQTVSIHGRQRVDIDAQRINLGL